MSRYLVFGAHPDDPEQLFGGCALKLAERKGHQVKFVSVSNGGCGHYALSSAELVRRRQQEVQQVKAVGQLTDYEVLDIPDCGVWNSLELRARLTRLIRQFQPDVVITHRSCDYHADHRETSKCVLDCAYLIRVPMYCPDTPIPKHDPVFAYGFDTFVDPRPIRADAAVEIDSVYDQKMRMLDCHKSQFFEWLPWQCGRELPDPAALSWPERRQYLERYWGVRDQRAAQAGLTPLVRTYGVDAHKIKCAELFEMSPYGAQVTPEAFQALFPR